MRNTHLLELYYQDSCIMHQLLGCLVHSYLLD